MVFISNTDNHTKKCFADPPECHRCPRLDLLNQGEAAVAWLCADICCQSGSEITPGSSEVAQAVTVSLRVGHRFLKLPSHLYPTYCTLVLTAKWCQSMLTRLGFAETKGGSFITASHLVGTCHPRVLRPQDQS